MKLRTNFERQIVMETRILYHFKHNDINTTTTPTPTTTTTTPTTPTTTTNNNNNNNNNNNFISVLTTADSQNVRR
jgi:hypothetical protein